MSGPSSSALQFPTGTRAFGPFEDAPPIERTHRLLYRERKDLQAHFKYAFSAYFAARLRADGGVVAP